MGDRLNWGRASSDAVAQEIRRQIGARAFYLMGAKNLTSTGRGPNEDGGLSWKVGRNAKGVTHVKVGLNRSDLYDVKFLRVRGTSVKVVSEHEGVYFDTLRELIERETGLALSL